MIQSPVAVNSCWENTENNIPSLTGTINAITETNEPFLSKANLALQNGASYLNIFFESSSPETFRNFSLNEMKFSPSGILFNSGDGNSSALTFVIPPAPVAEKKVCIPILNRRISPPPTILSQTFDYPVEISGASSIQNACQWCYNFHYDITSSAATQDTYKLQLFLSAAETDEKKNLQSAADISLARAFAQFLFVYPAISADLDKYLLAVTPLNAKSNSIEIVNAGYAVDAFVSITKTVTQSWADFSVKENSAKENQTQAQLTYSIVESADELTGDLLISINAGSDQAPFTGKITIPGYTTLTIDNTKNVYKFSDSNGTFLSFSGRLKNSMRIFSPNSFVDIMNTENIFTEIQIARNENLFGDAINGWEPANSGFISSSLRISRKKFAPLLDSDIPINIATVSPSETKQSLQNLIRNLFAALTKNVVDPQFIMSGSISYSYPQKDPDIPVTIPVSLFPQTNIETSEHARATADMWSLALQNWIQHTQTSEGKFLFAITIISTIDLKTPKLKLSLFLSLEDFVY
ncbi:MAG TPA: hypothetical protein VFJ43_04630, partial [Bacteroidia bacterium]|nr:hypothetical protein [Bacteroidia bacterium]